MFGCITMAIPAKTEPDLCVAVIQGNINSHDKWSPSSTELTKNVYASLTRKAAEEGAKLVVWPETAFPYALDRNPSLQFFVSDLAKECEITLIVGAFYSGEDSGQYNGLYLFYPDGSQAQTIYQKRHLVPFGEYVPMRDIIGTLIPPLTRLLGACPELSPGTGSALFDTEYGEIGSLICFDSIYEQLTLDSVNDGAELMVLSSNDSWFFDSAAVYQHFAQAQLRAIESGRWILRSANTGISGIISPEGEAFLQIAPLEEGYGIYNVALKETKNVYSVIGNLFVYLCISFIVCLFATEWTVRFSDRFFPGWRKKGILREKPEKRLDNHAEF